MKDMKRMVAFALASLGMLVSCSTGVNGMDESNALKATGNIATKEYKLSKFDRLDIEVVASTVRFVQGKEGEYRAVLSAPDNYIDLFRFDVDGRELNINFSKRNVIQKGKDIEIIVYAPVLCQLENSGVANVEIDGLKTSELEIENSGVGTVRVSGLDAKELEVECSGVGNVELKGRADVANYECSGVGNIKAADLKAKRVHAEVSGVGNVYCYASESIKGGVSGVGSLKYGGNPARKDLHRTGIGKHSPL